MRMYQTNIHDAIDVKEYKSKLAAMEEIQTELQSTKYQIDAYKLMLTIQGIKQKTVVNKLYLANNNLISLSEEILDVVLKLGKKKRRQLIDIALKDSIIDIVNYGGFADVYEKLDQLI